MTTSKQIRGTILEMSKASDRKIMHILGYEPKDVQQIRADMRDTGEIPEQKVDEELIDDI